jgi:hypothetical protein
LTSATLRAIWTRNRNRGKKARRREEREREKGKIMSTKDHFSIKEKMTRQRDGQTDRETQQTNREEELELVVRAEVDRRHRHQLLVLKRVLNFLLFFAFFIFSFFAITPFLFVLVFLLFLTGIAILFFIIVFILILSFVKLILLSLCFRAQQIGRFPVIDQPVRQVGVRLEPRQDRRIQQLESGFTVSTVLRKRGGERNTEKGEKERRGKSEKNRECKNK